MLIYIVVTRTFKILTSIVCYWCWQSNTYVKMNRNHFAWLLVSHVWFECVCVCVWIRNISISAQSKSHVPYKIYIVFVFTLCLWFSITRTKDPRYIQWSKFTQSVFDSLMIMTGIAAAWLGQWNQRQCLLCKCEGYRFDTIVSKECGGLSSCKMDVLWLVLWLTLWSIYYIAFYTAPIHDRSAKKLKQKYNKEQLALSIVFTSGYRRDINTEAQWTDPVTTKKPCMFVWTSGIHTYWTL